ncbi:nucleotide-sugar transporter [Bimuria novae-zelandiae CBS 107.79]|uniref:Nucleotide-sugar transporter n=1 Tax=Bimuria novae-zelandiae CBS 107.79 TaxID=1447943 RepID=A0A6A5VLP4_9PLEO|nr:nucleotide-sugar transporter [Bimuria novae-zelandiae CBS 107.79]
MSNPNATFRGVPLKHISLVTLVFQNSMLILIMHYSRIMPPVNGLRYHTSTSVFLNEVIKLGISATVALYDIAKNLPPGTPATVLFSNLLSTVFAGDSWKLAIPAALYTLQNSLQYVAVSNLDAATFQVTYQLKILTTAIFSVIMLGRVLSVKKWAALGLLMAGVAIVQLPQSIPEPAAEAGKAAEAKRWLQSIAKRSATYEGIQNDEAPLMNRSVGLMAVLIACALSGLAGVTFEKILKQSSTKQASLWVRNCQLSFWSLFPAFFIGIVFVDGQNIAKDGFFAGYNWVVWTAIGFQAAGGIIVALVINYADNIAKNFATSLSILVSCVASAYFFDFEITMAFAVGTAVVLAATYLYTQPDAPKPTTIAPLEGISTSESNEDADHLRPAEKPE